MNFRHNGWRLGNLLIWLALTLCVATVCGWPAMAAAQDDDNDKTEEPAGKGETEPALKAPTAPEAEVAECPEGLVRVNFNEADIRDIVKTMATMTDQNFMLDKAITGTVTIISPTCITPAEAYDVFLSVLYVNGLTTVKVGKLTKIIKRAEAQTQPIDTNTEGLGRDNEKYITQLIPLQNLDAVEIASGFRSLVSSDGNIFAYGPSNMLIIMDSAANINRLFRILQKLDVEGTEQILEVIPIEYASADTVADVIMQLFDSETKATGLSTGSSTLGGAGSVSQLRERLMQQRMQRLGRRTPGGATTPGSSGFSQSVAAGETLRIIPDGRTNSLVVKGSKYAIKRVRDVVAKLDQPLPGGEGKIHVVYLENADAVELAGILADLAGTGGGSSLGGYSSRQNQRRMGGTTGGYGSNSRAGSVANAFSSRFGGAAGGLSGSSSGTLGTGGLNRDAGNPTRGIAQTSGRFLADFEGAVRITADPATNSLVIIASNRDMEILREVIAKLDIPRPQVYVEVMIAEITAERGLDVGFEFRTTNDTSEDGVQVLGGSNYGGIQSAAANPLGITGFALGAADGTITFGGETYPNIGALFRAMQSDRDVNIMATPHILTTDNEEAEIVIADNIPFVTGQIYSQAFNNPTTTIERKDVGITLRITPTINESDMVRLMIYQESSSVTDSPSGLSASQVGVTTAKRSADTVVVVKSRQTVVIGGLMKDNISYTEAKVPVFGDIPILGYLFKSSKRKVEKTNLLIFITPYIIKDNGDLEEVTRMANYRLEQFRQENRIQRRDNLDEEKIQPNERIFRKEEPTAIEIDPTKRNAGATTEPGTEEKDSGEETPPSDDRGDSTDNSGDTDFGGNQGGQ
ncbi:MAG: type II secretion system secretin GspD [Myxococcales bacterium]|nr:type II secretion system secretin GspD [Myxococcales bacterium]